MPANAVGIGPLSSVARDMTRGPRGIAGYMADGGEASVVRLGGRRTKNAPMPVNAPEGRQPLTLTREDQGLLVDFMPIAGDIKGGVEGAEFISEELKREKPNYLLMGIVGGAAVLGVIPFAGDAAQKMIMRGARNFRKNRVTEDTLEMLSDQDANIVRDLTDKTPVSELTESQRLADEIASDLRSGNIDAVTDDRLELLDVQGDIRLRQHYIDGNVGTDADGVTITLDNNQREARMLAQGYDRVGVHGTMPMEDGASVNDIRVIRPSNSGKSGRGVYLDVEPTGMNFGDGEISSPSGIPYPTANRFAGYFPNPSAIDGGKNAHLRIPEGSQMYPLVLRGELAKNSTDMSNARAQIIAKNPEIGTIELNEQANQSLVDQGFTGIDSKHYGEITSFDGANLRAPTAIFDQRLTHLKNIGMADGGAVMNGIGTLNETARNMTRGPRGIGAYQQFAMGGEASGPPPMRGPDPYGIPQYADGGPIYMNQGGEAEVSEYRKALIMSESSGRSDVVNEKGYKGLTQAGDDALIDFKKEKGLDFTDEQYLDDPGLQMQFQDWYEQTTINFVMDKGLDAYMGRVIKGVPITMSSLLGMAHIGGNNGMRDFLESGGRDDPNDGNTSLSDYGIKFANMAIYGDSGGANINRATPEDIAESLNSFDDSLGYFRPQERPPEIEFSAPLTSLRPQARPTLEPEMRPQSRPLALPEGRSMVEKYGLPGDMPQGGIISAIR